MTMSEKLYKTGVGFGVILSMNGKILLGLRNSDPQKADSELHGEGTWTLPGGKLEYMESFVNGLEREVFEETNLKINKDNIKLIRLGTDMAPDAHFVTAGFFCDSFTGEPKVMEPDEITEWKWFDINKLPAKIYTPSQKVIAAWKSNIIWEQHYG